MVKRIWFQFTRKAHDEGEATAQSGENGIGTGAPQNADRAAPEEPVQPLSRQPSGEQSEPQKLPDDNPDSQPPPIAAETPLEQQERGAPTNAVLLRLSGNLWIHPAGEHRRVAITAERDIRSRNAAAFATILPAGIHLDVGEMRWLGGHMTAVHEESRAELSPDLPFSATAVIRLAYLALHVGELIFRPPGEGDVRGQFDDEPVAWGTGLLRQTEIYGTFFDERFHIEQLELERLQLIHGEQAWVGQLAQTVGTTFEGSAGRALVQQLRSAQSLADPLSLIRRIAQRHVRSIQAK